MKTNMEKNMEDIFNLPSDTKPMVEVLKDSRQIIEKLDAQNDEIDADYQYARDNLRSIINAAQASIEDLSSIASTSESPRAYEVLSGLIKTIVDANKDLLELQRKVKLLKQEEDSKPQNVTNALFVGSTTELQKLIKKNKDNIE
jgi:DNA-binding ferritin-like protein|tara:strand:- start:141 stop:572 length:432 start_codon:yes stop_codon:yes gene_type:complete